MRQETTLSIVLPAYLEAENLRLLLPRLKETLRSLGATSEILVVDTVLPMDDTPAICAEQGVTYVARTPSNCFGDAVRAGISHTRGRYVVFMDADGSHSPEFLPQLLEHAGQYDVVIASRYVSGGRTENSLPLVLMSRFLNVVYSAVLGLRCKDVSNSFKLYNGDRLRSLPLQCQNFDIVEEILVRLARDGRGLRIREVPFTFKPRYAGKTKRNLLLFMVTYLVTLVRLRFASRRTPAPAATVVPHPAMQASASSAASGKAGSSARKAA